MSLVARLCGVAFYFALQHGYKLHLHHPRGWTGRLLYTHAIDGMQAFAARLMRILENGSLQSYLAWMLASAVPLAALPFLFGHGAAGCCDAAPDARGGSGDVRGGVAAGIGRPVDGGSTDRTGCTPGPDLDHP
jgi:hypothetical protein